jgi:hypothetical protein
LKLFNAGGRDVNRWRAAASIVVVMMSSGVARAQVERAVDHFTPSPPGDRFVSVSGASVVGEELLRAALTLDYARAPLVYRSAPVIENEILFHIDMSMALWERVLVSGSLPVVLLMQGQSDPVTTAARAQLSAPNGPGLGDLSLGLRFKILDAWKGTTALAAGAVVWLPTGRNADFTGSSYAHVWPHVALSGVLGPDSHFAYAVNAGVDIQRSADSVDMHLGSDVRVGAGWAFLSTKEVLQFGPEVTLTLPVSSGEQEARPGVDMFGAVRVRFGDLVLSAAVGPALMRDAGAPRFRVLSSIAYTPLRESDADGDGIIDRVDACPNARGQVNEDPELNGCPSDRDEDGIVDVNDACPDEPGIANSDPRLRGCPVPTDRDHDGIQDKFDACPDAAGGASTDPKKNGCPTDTDGDGVLDAQDACPNERGVEDLDPIKNGCPSDKDGDGIADAEDACPARPGPPSVLPSKNGCPVDTDGDGVPDAVDACPKERGVESSDASKRGCPVYLRYANAQLELLAPLAFDARSASTNAKVEPALLEIIRLLEDHPEIAKLTLRAPPGLANARAVSVMRYLVSHGVLPGRLVVKEGPSAGLRFLVTVAASIAR